MNALRSIAWLSVILGTACGTESTSPLSPPAPATAAPEATSPRQIVSISLSVTPSLLIGGMVPHVFATLRGGDSTVITDRSVTWTSSNEAVARAVRSCNPFSAICTQAGLIAVSDGSSTITAAAEGVSVSWEVSVSMKPAPSDALIVESFSIVELQYPSSALWYYAPLVSVRERTGMRPATVVGIEITIPGIGASRFCGGTRNVPAGASVDLFNATSYGDFEVVMYRLDGTRASGQPASATIFVRDASGGVGSLTVAGLVQPGTFPAPGSRESTPEEQGVSC